jgi:hypothetical protein
VAGSEVPGSMFWTGSPGSVAGTKVPGREVRGEWPAGIAWWEGLGGSPWGDPLGRPSEGGEAVSVDGTDDEERPGSGWGGSAEDALVAAGASSAEVPLISEGHSPSCAWSGRAGHPSCKESGCLEGLLEVGMLALKYGAAASTRAVNAEAEG